MWLRRCPIKAGSDELLRLSGWLSQQADYWDNQDYHSTKPQYVEKANHVRDLATRCEGMVDPAPLQKELEAARAQIDLLLSAHGKSEVQRLFEITAMRNTSAGMGSLEDVEKAVYHVVTTYPTYDLDSHEVANLIFTRLKGGS